MTKASCKGNRENGVQLCKKQHSASNSPSYLTYSIVLQLYKSTLSITCSASQSLKHLPNGDG